MAADSSSARAMNAGAIPPPSTSVVTSNEFTAEAKPAPSTLTMFEAISPAVSSPDAASSNNTLA